MVEFYCFSCNKHKKMEHLSKSKPSGGKFCQACVDKITMMREAEKRRNKRER
jgi:hypothetical protein